jgi:hypothetical protein
VLQPNDERGPYCHHIAYPVARIAARALTPDHDPAKFGQFLGNLSFALIKDITIVLNQLIAQALRNSIPKFIKDRFVSFAKDTLIGQVWNDIADLINIAGKIEEFFNDKVLNPVLTRIVEPLVQKLSAWNGNPVTQAVNEFLARRTFELYSVGCLLDTSDDRRSPPRFGDLTLSLPQLLGLIGQVNLPDRFEINADLNFEALDPPSWWKSPPLPSWDPLRWSFHVGVFSFSLSGLIVGISLNRSVTESLCKFVT